MASAGYRAIAPDQRGYAGTDAPLEIDAYDHVELALDVIALMDTLGVDRAPLVAHDWGAALAWNVALLHPDRISAVVALSVAYGGRAPAPPVQILERRMGDLFFYMLYFQKPGIAETELEADVRESLRVFFYAASGDAPPGSAFTPVPKTAKLFDSMTAPPGLPAWLTEHDLDVYTEAFRESGFRGPINWYRTMNRTWERTAHLADAKVTQPSLFIAGDRDPVGADQSVAGRQDARARAEPRRNAHAPRRRALDAARAARRSECGNHRFPEWGLVRLRPCTLARHFPPFQQLCAVTSRESRRRGSHANPGRSAS